MFKPVLRYVLLPLSILLTQCKPSGSEALQNAVGRPGQLVAVSDEATLQALGKDLGQIFTQAPADSSGTPPFFELLKPTIPEFLQLFYNQRTILLLVTPDNSEELEEALAPFSDEEIQQLIASDQSGIVSRKDVLARHQHIAYLFGKNAAQLRQKLNQQKAAIVQSLLASDLNSYKEMILSDTGKNSRFSSEFKEKYGISVRIPESFRLLTESTNFYWFQMDETENGMAKNIGLMVHAYPYKDSSDLTYESIRSVRDTFCRHHIPGELPGTYMSTTESKFYPARTFERIDLNGYKTCKVKGWWTIKGITMSGPFVRYVVHVPEKNILFAFEGFVYRPELNLKERDIRIIEAIALSIQ